MTNREIAALLNSRMGKESEVIFEITLRDVLSEIVKRFREEALSLSEDDLQMAREEVKDAVAHNLDPREYIDMGLDSWEIARAL